METVASISLRLEQNFVHKDLLLFICDLNNNQVIFVFPNIYSVMPHRYVNRVSLVHTLNL